MFRRIAGYPSYERGEKRDWNHQFSRRVVDPKKAKEEFD